MLVNYIGQMKNDRKTLQVMFTRTELRDRLGKNKFSPRDSCEDTPLLDQ